jgi:DNA-binding NarL/FixJ family response regulator
LGVSGYLLKISAAWEVAKAIHNAMRGLTYITPSMERELENALVEDPRSQKERSELSLRQREVLQLLAEGRPMKEIAFILKLTPRTVAYHKYEMMRELGLKSTAELIRYAVMNRLVPSETLCSGSC